VRDRVWSWKGQRPPSGLRSVLDTRVPWEKVEWTGFLLAALLVSTGILFVWQMAASDIEFGRDGIRFMGHVKKLAVAMPAFFLGFFVRPRWLRRHAWLFYGGAIALLFLVPVIGEERNNARRWIPIPGLGFDLQPSELAKIGLIVILAQALYRNRLQNLSDWFLPGALALLPMGLVVAQPDLGTALTIVPVTLGMCWLAGAPRRTMFFIVAVGFLVGTVAWQQEWVQGYQKKRIDTWLASFEKTELVDNKNGSAFHAYQSRVGIGNGGFLGTGLGLGVANEAGHLPERESDSIFAVIAEEGGFFGATALVLLYVGMASMLLLAAGRTRERFSRLVVGGVALYFAAHFFINIGVNLGLLPMTGLTLPLISTGGSSLLTSFLALGLGLGLSARYEPSLDRDAFRA